jgi:outer membrane receptor protein involved in Fe transport
LALANNGTGYNYGAEITLEKYFSNNYYFLITGSIFDSKYKGSDNVLRNTKYNGNYVYNLLGGKEFKLRKNKTFGVSVRASMAGGLRYTPIDLERSIEEQRTVRDTVNIYEPKRDDFLRIDLKLRYRINKKKTTRQWEIDIQNVSNTLNVAGDYFNTTSQQITTYSQVGIIPVLSYRIEF